ncbi:MAG: cell division protein FtsL [Deltaproteobacteria bacterium]|nr:cell division protein FtsL [Deltaproteobacteria bacterium]
MTKIKPYFIILVIILTILGIFYVWTAMESIKLGYDITKLNDIKSKLEHKNKKLLIKKTALSSPSRIYGIAKKMGFIYPKEGEIIMVHD